MNSVLEQVMRRQDTWVGRAEHFAPARAAANSDSHGREHLSTGYSTLDAALRGQGWPLGNSIELLSDASGMGAMGLFLPAMASLSAQQRQWLVFIAPPFVPYAPLLEARGIDTRQVLLVHPRSREDLLWSTEQALRSSTCSAVFSWLGSTDYRYSELRKLQLAATSRNSLSVLFRAAHTGQQHAPAALRLQMTAYRQVQLLKQRGGKQGLTVELPVAEDIPGQPQLWELPASPAGTAPVAAPAAR
ncbi:translesion DNA synthesis-associated protein ImuA [Chromatocurvus halotolerans]|uniref:Cell division inhibitor SulA/protein ImuA n=1 Tax=Chromatocurvus halotolerans TaxID=1132028 RepID=A0A4R2K9X9_9GAMM|nr:translesion DNA synthesis-associated protein ImuA [Chromatocurvus halotolerans]TCO70233.1 cell division inhibitor SulA/protein ImuA [Chromatocurvus halotolerans]